MTHKLIDVVAGFLEADSWPFEREVEGGIRTAFGGKHGRWFCFIGAVESRQQVTFLSVCPREAPPDRRAAIAEFLHRANYGLFVGNFELDFDSGRVQCRTGIDVEGDELSPAQVKNLVYNNVLLMDRYLWGIMSVIENGTHPVDAINAIEA